MPTLFCFKDAKRNTYVQLSDIIRFEADDNYTKAFLTNKDSKTISECLGSQYERVKSSGLFFRIHKSHIVNLLYVMQIYHNGTLVLTDGTQLPVSETVRQELIKKMPSC